MPLPFDFLPENGRNVNVNLSTSSSASSSALLSDVRAQRAQREQQRVLEKSAIVLQKFWRERSQGAKFTQELLDKLDNGAVVSVDERARFLVVIFRRGWMTDETKRRRENALVKWFDQVSQTDPSAFIQPSPDWMTVLAILCLRAVSLIAQDPNSAQTAATLLKAIPSVFRDVTTAASDSGRIDFVEVLGRGGWVQELVIAMDKLIATNKKNPFLVPVTQLLTSPLSLSSSAHTRSLLYPLINHLLAIPALPSSLPIPALTHLSIHLPLFKSLLPLAAAEPEIIRQGRLSNEQGRTYLLANLAIFGITGGLLERSPPSSAVQWIKVIGSVLRSMTDGWGRWIEGIIEDDDEPIPKAEDDEDSDGEIVGSSKKRARRTSGRKSTRRQPLPKNISSKILLLAGRAHLVYLAATIISPASKLPSSSLGDFAAYALALLDAFRGSPKWESILEALLIETKGKAFSKRVWREGVRGRWTSSSNQKTWDTFMTNPSTPCLLLLTHIYCHYLLITPDAEFFTETVSGSNPLSLDEVLELAAVWRDLAYWSYMNGVAATGSPSNEGRGNEDVRALLTRGLTRISDRNARRKFAPDNFFVTISPGDLRGFIAAAVMEDAALTEQIAQGSEIDPADLPRWARARNRFTKRQMAYISPRLGLLNNLPMVLPFNTRLEIFQKFIDTDMVNLGLSRYSRRGIRATIHRTSLAEDGFNQLSDVGPMLKGRIGITFIDKFGQEEAGIDGGGLFKEFLTSLNKEVFNTDRGLWLATDQNELYPNPHSYATEPHQLAWYTFIGRVLGKAMYDGILVDVSFAGFFLAKWLGRSSSIDDLQSLDNELYKGLIVLKSYPRPEELSLNFTIVQEEFGQTQTIDLVPGGSDIPVTVENRHEYIQLVCRYKLDKQISAQSRAFFSGLSDIIDSKWLRMFDQKELQQVIGGEETPIDIDDLRANTEVSGFANDDTIQVFWKVVKGFNQQERRALLRFVTSCSRPPLLGFRQLSPRFGIRCSGNDTGRLPSASSCMNLLKLPSYDNEVALRSKLLQAINSNAGFDLS
ncbi:hypothetical protein BD324DRAFT_665268 [Kockovaella imperatae]|uniref:HECT-type E3 ubiquitin transferase n=1 Tax=Kockovaella imperatae TaxID=4999 RepID=A0A1Y1U8P2_9TREE|nr:hypothetical protein BD324DRAFT_665268 [Kockovaella imperatae]ORX33914.1 hypothetical protein BD324DRAFT_665268 [Kockovaella imperatae]